MNSMGRKYEENEDRLRILKKSFIKMFEEETLADFVIKVISNFLTFMCRDFSIDESTFLFFIS